MSTNKDKSKWLILYKVSLFFGIVGLLIAGVVLNKKHNIIDQRIEIEQILNNSVLKDKKFSAHIESISTDDLSAYFMEEHSNPIISLSFNFRYAGTAYEDDAKQGVGTMLSDMLLNGAGEYNALQFNDMIEEYGIKISFDITRDDFSGQMLTTTENLPQAISLLQDVLYKPQFDDKYIEITRQQMQTGLKLISERASSVLNDKFAEIIFASHPYSRSQIGKKETIANLNKEDLRDFMQKHFNQENLLIGIAGDIDKTTAENIIKQIFAKLPKKSSNKQISSADIKINAQEHNIEYPSAQIYSRFAVKGTCRQCKDFYALYIANYILGGAGLNSRLNKIMREENGLTYGIYTSMSINDAANLLEGNFSTTPENFAKAKELLLSEWHKMAQQGISIAELNQTKEALIASFNLRFANINNISDILVAMQKYSLGIDFLDKRNDYIRNLTLDEVNAAAHKYFSIDPETVNIGFAQEEKM